MGCTQLLFLDLPGEDPLRDLHPGEHPVAAHAPSCHVWYPCLPGASQILCLDSGAGGGRVRLCMGATGSAPTEQNLTGSFSIWHCVDELIGLKSLLVGETNVGLFCCSSEWHFFSFCLSVLGGNAVLHGTAEKPGVMLLSNNS